jgi:YegS/Rv2252/BmrU family lipid kinase
MKSVTLICRLSSRHGLAFYQRLHEELPKRGVLIVEAHMVRRRKDLRQRVRQAVKSGCEVIAVVGGDGTQTAAVAELAHTKSVMAVVPAGTGNSFALSLGIKPDVEDAIETIVNGKETRIDVGIVNGTYFANFATVGVISVAAARTPKPLKKVVGAVAYGIAALGEFFRGKPFKMCVAWRKSKLSIVTHQAIVAGGRYFGWQPLLPHANVRDGELAFFAAEGSTVADALETNAALLLGDHTKLAHAHYFSSPKITIETKPKQRITIDGHAIGKTPAKFSVAPKALRVLVPRDFEART